jgi:2-oxoglutarate dehydrogenase E2 component (dihydrolipoamide succinyltransferase)
MAIEIRVPSLGESIVEATINKWLKQEGDTVAAGEPLLELETDKVNLEVPAEQAGVIEAIQKREGETVAIGDVLGFIGAPGSAEQPQPAPPAAQGMGSDGSEGAPAPRAPQPPSPAPSPSPEPQAVGANEGLATPVALSIAAENEVDIRHVPGSGAGGRVTREDVLSYLQTTTTNREEPVPGESAPSPAPARPSEPAPGTSSSAPAPLSPAMFQPGGGERREERVPMSRRRQTIARRLLEAQHNAAMLTTFNEIDMGTVTDIRQRHKERFKEQYGVRLGFMSFFVKAAIGALKTFPLLNAEIQGEEMVLKHYYDIGIAVGAEQGLVVPVLRDADRKTFAQIEQGIADLATRARENTLTLTELQGGTFSITNGGIYGSLMSTPILNTPQVGILGLHKIEERPVAVQGAVQVRPMMYVALSYDHRLVDGSEAVQFLVRVKALMEDPEALLLEG